MKKLLYVSPNVQGHLKEGDIPTGYFSYNSITEIKADAAVNLGEVRGVYMLVLDKDDYDKAQHDVEKFNFNFNFNLNYYWICCEHALVTELHKNKLHAIHLNDWLEGERVKGKQDSLKPNPSPNKEKSVSEIPAPKETKQTDAPKSTANKRTPTPIPSEKETESVSAVSFEEEPIAFVDDQVVLGTGGKEINEEPPIVHYEENPHHVKKREIQKKLFSNTEWSNHKIIGIWSPTGKCGTTLTAINLALAFAEMRVYTTVLEGLTTKPQLKQHLDSYSTVPNGWVSYASCIQGENNPRDASWIYDNVVFLPMTDKDLDFNWTPQLIETYMTAPKITDVTFVDLASGRFSDYMKDALHCLDEIWVMYDDNYHDLMSWKMYFQSITETFDVNMYGIMGRSYEFSKAEKIAESAGLTYLTSIPAMDKEVMQHYYGSLPLWRDSVVKESFFDSYNVLYEHIFSKKMQLKDEKVATKLKWPRAWTNVLEKLAPKF